MNIGCVYPFFFFSFGDANMGGFRKNKKLGKVRYDLRKDGVYYTKRLRHLFICQLCWIVVRFHIHVCLIKLCNSPLYAFHQFEPLFLFPVFFFIIVRNCLLPHLVQYPLLRFHGQLYMNVNWKKKRKKRLF